jgi:glutamine synthetase
MSIMDKDEVLRLARENDVKFIRLQFTDLFGALKNIAITIDHLEKALNNQYMFDGSSIDGFVRIEESDMFLYPDPDTFTIFPWRPQSGRVARLVCDIHNPDETAFDGDPRTILKKALKNAADMGYLLNVGPECEFFLFQTDNNGKPTAVTHDNASYFDLGPMDLGEDARRDICLTLEDLGFSVEASHHEVAFGQHEIDFRYDEALRTADNIMTFKLVVKTVAKRHGLAATFMPKPLEGMSGSGMHTNMSLSKNGRNAFNDETDALGLSTIAYSFMAGIMEHIQAITAITNPLVNSYKRLIPGFEAPVYVAWATKNRSPLIRIPAIRGEATRVELRSPDSACNPYLAFAVILEAGLDGIRRNLTPPSPVERNIYDMSSADRIAGGIASLPTNLAEALTALENDTLVLSALGQHTATKFLEAKWKEWKDYETCVHAWELDKYLSTF